MVRYNLSSGSLALVAMIGVDDDRVIGLAVVDLDTVSVVHGVRWWCWLCCCRVVRSHVNGDLDQDSEEGVLTRFEVLDVWNQECRLDDVVGEYLGLVIYPPSSLLATVAF